MRKIYFLLFIALLSFQSLFSQTYHSLAGGSFLQNWSNTGLITTDDTWTGVTSIIGYRGDNITGATGVDPQTLLGEGTITIDVIANQANPNTNVTGGLAEFDGIANPVVAFQGSGTADAPSLVIFLNSTGRSNIRVVYNLRDIDGSADNAIQPVALQYRIGTTGNFTNVPGAFVADASTGPSTATLVTPVDVFLPAACDNQAQLQIRIITSNAVGNDEWIGIDDIDISSSAAGSIASVTATTNAQEPATNGSFTINLSAPAPVGGTTISYTLAGTASIGGGNDFTDPQSGSVTIAAGNSNAVVSMNVADDAITEPNETVILTLTNATNGVSINSTPATILILDNESSSVLHTTYNVCTALPVESFTAFSVTGAEVWGCTTFGYNNSNGLQMNGFNGGPLNNEDWLISPAVDLSATNIPLLFFRSRNRFAGDQLKLLVSTNYIGSGNPNAATWTEINGDFPAANTDVWKYSENINLSAFKVANVYIAFKYTSTTTAAARWTVDEVNIVNTAIAPPSSITTYKTLLDFRFTANGGSSAAKSFTFWGNNLTADLTVTPPAGFELSKDNTTFSGAVVYTPAELNTEKTLWVRYTPTGVNLSQYGYLSFTSTGLITALNYQAVFVKANSYPIASSVNIVNYNLEWFGLAGLGPVDDDLQRDNAITVLNYLSPDIIALQEIVDEPRFNAVVSGLTGGYASFLSEFCSGGTTPAACASSQKLAFIYKTSVVSNVSARKMNLNNANWANGRTPYIITATVTKNGQARAMSFLVLHGKAGSTLTDYNQRLNGSTEMKDSLNAFFSTGNVIILGDFNDDLDVSIYTSAGTQPSSYTNLISDSTDADSYKSVTLPLSTFGLSSTATNPEVIDHAVISNELVSAYIPLSASLYDDIGTLAGVANYSTTTSDHFPIMTRYLFGGILPVNLVSFTAVKQGLNSKLNWSTAQETNSREFIIERSADGSNFTEIGRVTAAGNSSSAINYEWTDTRPLKGRNFYRLRQVDLNNQAVLSRVASVLFNKNGVISIYPNPASSLVEILTDISAPAMVTVQLTDINGRAVKTQRENISAGQVMTMNIESVTRGMYILKIIYNNTVLTEKLMVQ